MQAGTLSAARRLLLMAGTLTCATGCSSWFETSTTPPDAFVVRAEVGPIDRMSFRGERIDRSEVSRAELAGACQLFVDWQNDDALGLSMKLLDDDASYRAAELLGGEYLGVEAALIVEEQRLSGRSDADALDAVEEELGAVARAEAERFLQDRAQPPAASARQRFVVYLTAATVTDGIVTFRSVEPFGEVVGIGWGQAVHVTRPDGERIRVDPDWCNDPP